MGEGPGNGVGRVLGSVLRVTGLLLGKVTRGNKMGAHVDRRALGVLTLVQPSPQDPGTEEPEGRPSLQPTGRARTRTEVPDPQGVCPGEVDSPLDHPSFLPQGAQGARWDRGVQYREAITGLGRGARAQAGSCSHYSSRGSPARQDWVVGRGPWGHAAPWGPWPQDQSVSTKHTTDISQGGGRGGVSPQDLDQPCSQLDGEKASGQQDSIW